MAFGSVRIRSLATASSVSSPAIGRSLGFAVVPTLFTRIINGELPGRFVWRDDQCVAFLSIAPLRPGHTLVVPIAEVDEWTDLEPALASHLMVVAQTIAQAQKRAFKPS